MIFPEKGSWVYVFAYSKNHIVEFSLISRSAERLFRCFTQREGEGGGCKPNSERVVQVARDLALAHQLTLFCRSISTNLASEFEISYGCVCSRGPPKMVVFLLVSRKTQQNRAHSKRPQSSLRFARFLLQCNSRRRGRGLRPGAQSQGAQRREGHLARHRVQGTREPSVQTAFFWGMSQGLSGGARCEKIDGVGMQVPDAVCL